MKNSKLSTILFSLAVIVALTLAALPAAPAYALSASSATGSIAVNHSSAPVISANHIWVCRTIRIWRNHHLIVIRHCHRLGDRR